MTQFNITHFVLWEWFLNLPYESDYQIKSIDVNQAMTSKPIHLIIIIIIIIPKNFASIS